jgi:intracellular multiplication protein IcmT
MASYSDSAHWRDSARSARFFMMDARAVFPFVLFLMHIKWWTFWVAVVGMLFFIAIEKYGFTVPIFLRWLRTSMVGAHKPSRPWWRE